MSAKSVSPPTSDLRHLDGTQQGAEGGPVAEGTVGVPGVLEALDLGVAVEAHDIRGELLLGGGDQLVVPELTPVASHRPELVWGEGLVAKDEHLPLEQRGIELIAEGVVQNAQVEPAHFGTNGGGERFEAEVLVAAGFLALVKTSQPPRPRAGLEYGRRHGQPAR
jgi:hypothetical protein